MIKTLDHVLKSDRRHHTHIPLSNRPIFSLRLAGQDIIFGKTTKIMGIVNATPDSFSKDGRVRASRSAKNNTAAVLRRAFQLIKEGADIIDIGGESSRPGALRVGIKEEMERIIPAISILAKKTDVPISADTYKTSVAMAALDAGASIINSIKGTDNNKNLLKMVARYNAAVVLMHIKGTPRTMQKHAFYNDVIKELISSLKQSIDICLEVGIPSDKIIIDPGIGFGKSAEHNLQILNRLEAFHSLNCPILVGTSRKSFIGKILDKPVEDRLWGTAATIAASILKGAHIIRVHDVSSMRDVARTTDAIINESFTLTEKAGR